MYFVFNNNVILLILLFLVLQWGNQGTKLVAIQLYFFVSLKEETYRQRNSTFSLGNTE